MGKKAVVLGGGGSRGSYQVGVWKALLELGFDYEIVTGTSVGALNGALMVQKDYELAQTMWQQLKTRDVMDVEVTDKVESPKDFTDKAGAFIAEMVKNGGADPRPLEQMLRSYIDEEKIRVSPVEFGFMTVEYPKLEPKVLTKETVPTGELVDYLMASAACFPAMQARVIGDKTYIDGGYSDNVPVKVAVDLGADDIVAVDLEAIGVIRKMEFPAVRLRYLKSRWDLGIFLLFDSDMTARNIQLGYLETLKAFGKREGCLYTFLPGEGEALYRRVEKQSDLLLAKSGMYPIPGSTYPAQARAQRKLRQMLDRPDGRLDGSMIALACCEAAARLLGVPPLEAYTAASIEAAVLERYLQLETEKVPQSLAARSAKELTRHLMGLERQMVLLYCCRCLDEMMDGHFSPAAARALCSAVTEEFLAAMYLCSLRSTREKEE
ncbi:MAG: patatin-like phospholipase family protein [Oscillospiraceae bacterium]|nr:patatin-like phospholipase family protein [Oscillospiraceae bacterium]